MYLLNDIFSLERSLGAGSCVFRGTNFSFECASLSCESYFVLPCHSLPLLAPMLDSRSLWLQNEKQ